MNSRAENHRRSGPMSSAAPLSEDVAAIVEARHHDPFSVLGRHSEPAGELVRAYVPGAVEVNVANTVIRLQRINNTDIFEWRGPGGLIPEQYQFEIQYSDGRTKTDFDPYSFPPQIADYDLHLFGEGRHWHAHRFLGAHEFSVDGITGTLFATWAPNAERVSVVGDFNGWDGRRHPMRVRGGSGIWELFIPGIGAQTLYKFELRSRGTGDIHLKTDPYGQAFELRPATASVVLGPSTHEWGDAAWIGSRTTQTWLHGPISIYEVHLGSWQRDEHGEFLNYRELAKRLANYVQELGFTHVELLPVTEHPLDQSWGYQTIGYYAPTRRHGQPDDFRFFVDYMHSHGIGVILDWVPAHFPKDAHGLARFDGSALYEHADPRRGEHRDWGTLIFNYGRNEVRNFLLSSALFWLEEYHIDGLRVDAVASLLYLDYSRQPGDWVPNVYGGNENLEAIDFIRHLNTVAHELHPGTVIIAEESTAWPMVSRPIWLGGLGFSMKWNMGWMHDTLQYMSHNPVHRRYYHDMLTFSQLYAYTENFVLPFSHDEVVHGKQSLLNKMPGDEWQKFANLRLVLTYMFTHPGKKLLFMGCEFGQGREWNSFEALDWYVLDYPLHQGIRTLIRDLNSLYCNHRELYHHDFESAGFEWVDCHDADQSVLTYIRRCGDDHVIVALNFTPVPRHGYRIGVPRPGQYTEILNSDSAHYSGSNVGNSGAVHAESIPWMNRPYSISVTLPPLAAVVFTPS